MTHALQQYSFGQLHNEDDKRLALLRSFINDVRGLLSQRIQPQASPQQQVQTQGVNNVGTSSPAPSQSGK